MKVMRKRPTSQGTARRRSGYYVYLFLQGEYIKLNFPPKKKRGAK